MHEYFQIWKWLEDSRLKNTQKSNLDSGTSTTSIRRLIGPHSLSPPGSDQGGARLGGSWWAWSPSPWLGLMPKVGVLGEEGNAEKWDYRKTTMQALWCQTPKGLCMCSVFQLWWWWDLLQQMSVLRLQQRRRGHWNGMVNLHQRPPQCLSRQKEENIDVFLLDIDYSVKNMFF